MMERIIISHTKFFFYYWAQQQKNAAKTNGENNKLLNIQYNIIHEKFIGIGLTWCVCVCVCLIALLKCFAFGNHQQWVLNNWVREQQPHHHQQKYPQRKKNCHTARAIQHSMLKFIGSMLRLSFIVTIFNRLLLKSLNVYPFCYDFFSLSVFE